MQKYNPPEAGIIPSSFWPQDPFSVPVAQFFFPQNTADPAPIPLISSHGWRLPS
jgi:hypothetical protein